MCISTVPIIIIISYIKCLWISKSLHVSQYFFSYRLNTERGIYISKTVTSYDLFRPHRYLELVLSPYYVQAKRYSHNEVRCTTVPSPSKSPMIFENTLRISSRTSCTSWWIQCYHNDFSRHTICAFRPSISFKVPQVRLLIHSC